MRYRHHSNRCPVLADMGCQPIRTSIIGPGKALNDEQERVRSIKTTVSFPQGKAAAQMPYKGACGRPSPHASVAGGKTVLYMYRTDFPLPAQVDPPTNLADSSFPTVESYHPEPTPNIHPVFLALPPPYCSLPFRMGFHDHAEGNTRHHPIPTGRLSFAPMPSSAILVAKVIHLRLRSQGQAHGV